MITHTTEDMGDHSLCTSGCLDFSEGEKAATGAHGSPAQREVIFSIFIVGTL